MDPSIVQATLQKQAGAKSRQDFLAEVQAYRKDAAVMLQAGLETLILHTDQGLNIQLIPIISKSINTARPFLLGP